MVVLQMIRTFELIQLLAFDIRHTLRSIDWLWLFGWPTLEWYVLCKNNKKMQGIQYFIFNGFQ